MNPRSSVLSPPSAEIVVSGVDTGSKTGTLPQGPLNLSDRPGTPVTLPSGQSKNLTPQEVQWVLAGWPAVKLFIQEEGWYRVTQPELVAAGSGPQDQPPEPAALCGWPRAGDRSQCETGRPVWLPGCHRVLRDGPGYPLYGYAGVLVGGGGKAGQAGAAGGKSEAVRPGQPVFRSRWSRSPGRSMSRPS